MGKANRDRRRSKEKARKQARATTRGAATAWASGTAGTAGQGASFFGLPPIPPLPPPTPRQRVEELVDEAINALDQRDQATAAACAARLAVEGAGWRPAVERALDDFLTDVVGTLWNNGWQPADVLRITARSLKAPHLLLVRAAIARQMSGYAPATVDPRWSAQLAEADAAAPWWPRELTAVQACARTHPDGWQDLTLRILELLHLLATLPPVELLLPRPGTAVASAARPPSDVDERVLARVRALLAKAESTTFPAEAETFTAGAQALMARHSIDHAMLAAAGRTPADEPLGRRLGIDNPYEAPKAALLDAVASANRCRAVWAKHLGFATVVGHPTDLDTVEVLFTSLLVQATAAMTGQGSRTHRGGGSRTRSFRQSFLLSYAHRIRERLTETTRQETASAAARPGNDALLPVLRSRDEAVERATEAMFPHLTVRAPGHAWDREGWTSGRAAADLATLATGRPVTG